MKNEPSSDAAFLMECSFPSTININEIQVETDKVLENGSIEIQQEDSAFQQEEGSTMESSIDTFKKKYDEEICSKYFITNSNENVMGTLQDLLDIIGPLPDFIARAYFLHLLDAISNLHNFGITTLDLSTDSTFLTEDFTPKLLLLEQTSLSDEIITSSLLSGQTAPSKPMLAENGFGRTDLFSSALVLFHMIAGYTPFDILDANDEDYKLLLDGRASDFWDGQENLYREYSGISQRQKFSDSFRNLFETAIAKDSKRSLRISELRTHPWCRGPSQPFEKIKEFILEILKKKSL